MNESRAARHQRLRRRGQTVAAAGGIVLLAVLALTPAGRSLAEWADGVTAGLPGLLAPAAGLVLFVAVVVSGWEAATLPALLVSGPVRAGDGLRGGPMLSGAAVGLVVAFPAVLAVAVSIQFAAFVSGTTWWLTAGILVATALVVLMHSLPGLLARLSGARPVTRPALVERLGALSRRIHVPIHSIDELPAGSAATGAALVAGGGSGRRVFIAADLIRDWSDEEVAFVVAHEFAHHAHRDLWYTLALDTALLIASFFVADRMVSLLAAPLALPPIGSHAVLPFVALVVALVWTASAPVRHAVSRGQERRADDFALRLTGSADAFRTALRRLASQHLAEESPSRITRWLFHRHPSVAERLATADQYDKTAYR
ncbi:MAG TPA: M48 family metalloprotease [Vicinamibacterales bacterium]|nr:M48 family metalloprotease [Vicinamibacterales bacterium]